MESGSCNQLQPQHSFEEVAGLFHGRRQMGHIKCCELLDFRARRQDLREEGTFVRFGMEKVETRVTRQVTLFDVSVFPPNSDQWLTGRTIRKGRNNGRLLSKHGSSIESPP
jgi:hypothetical protein